MTADNSWFCKTAGEEYGPLSAHQLKALVASQKLTPADHVRRGRNGAWVSASRVKGLFSDNPPSEKTEPPPLPKAESAGTSATIVVAPAKLVERVDSMAVTRSSRVAQLWSFCASVVKKAAAFVQQVLSQTARHISRAVAIIVLFASGYKVRRNVEDAKLALGKQMYKSGQGDPQLISQIVNVTRQIESDSPKAQSPHLTQQRRKLTMLLAENKTTTENGSTAICAEREAVDLLTEQAEALSHRIAELRLQLVPREFQTWLRLVVGYGMFGCLIFVLLVPRMLGTPSGLLGESQFARARLEGRAKRAKTAPQIRAVDVPAEDDAPLLGDLVDPQEIAEESIRVESDVYQARGFRNLRFGESQDEVAPLAKASFDPSEGRHECFYSQGQFIGYERFYRHQDDEIIEQIKTLFGPVEDYNITTATSGRSNYEESPQFNTPGIASASRSDQVLCRYSFPECLAYCELFHSVRAQSNSGAMHNRFMRIALYDREWLTEQLTRDIALKQRILKWAQAQFTRIATEGGPLDALAFPGSRLQIGGQEDAATVERATLVVDGSLPLCVIERVRKEDMFAKPVGTLSMLVRVVNTPQEPLSPAYRTPDMPYEIHRANSLVAQSVFSPRGSSISVISKANTHARTYEWRTPEGWLISVRPGNVFYISTLPEKQL